VLDDEEEQTFWI